MSKWHSYWAVCIVLVILEIIATPHGLPLWGWLLVSTGNAIFADVVTG